jgi:hypothetical protein
MSNLDFVLSVNTFVLVLLGFNIFQYFFWTWQVHKLIDKMMSRNFAEYVQATKPLEPDAPKVQLPEEEDILKDLNRMLS